MILKFKSLGPSWPYPPRAAQKLIGQVESRVLGKKPLYKIRGDPHAYYKGRVAKPLGITSRIPPLRLPADKIVFLGRTLATECLIEFARDILIRTSWDQDRDRPHISPGRKKFHRFVPKDQRLLFGLDKQAGTGSSSRYHSNGEAHLPITGGELKGSKLLRSCFVSLKRQTSGDYEMACY